jgi:hypothetical protein
VSSIRIIMTTAPNDALSRVPHMFLLVPLTWLRSRPHDMLHQSPSCRPLAHAMQSIRATTTIFFLPSYHLCSSPQTPLLSVAQSTWPELRTRRHVDLQTSGLLRSECLQCLFLDSLGHSFVYSTTPKFVSKIRCAAVAF